MIPTIEVPRFSYHRPILGRSQGQRLEAPLPPSPTVSSVSSVTRSTSVSSATVDSESSVSASSAASVTLVDTLSHQSLDVESLEEMITALSLSRPPTPSSPQSTGSIAGRPPQHHNIAQAGNIPFPTPDGEGKTYEIGVHRTNAWFVPCHLITLKC